MIRQYCRVCRSECRAPLCDVCAPKPRPKTKNPSTAPADKPKPKEK